jgi:hypothetical protein
MKIFGRSWCARVLNARGTFVPGVQSAAVHHVVVIPLALLAPVINFGTLPRVRKAAAVYMIHKQISADS